MRALRTLLFATATGLFVVVSPAGATTSNVVPNPGFEQAGCGDNTPDICGWRLAWGYPSGYMVQDTVNAHSGSASMTVEAGGETGGEFGGWGAEAITDPASCAAIGPGAHPASFWFRADTDTQSVDLGAIFFPTSDCMGTGSLDAFGQAPSSTEWQQGTGTLTASSGTQSALFFVIVFVSCDNYSGCDVAANFYDVDVEDTVVTTPTISSFSPTSGPIGTRVEIIGSNFTGATAVTFNGSAAPFMVDSDSQLPATVPNGATSGPISVTTPNGTGTASSWFTVNAPAPTIDSFNPTSGPLGTSVDIAGSNFTGATAVTFNGSAAPFMVDSDSQLHATVPNGATSGPISVTTPNGTGTSLSWFTVNAPPFARLTLSCSALTCSFDGSASTDTDGTIQSYGWSFGDGTSGAGKTVAHSYAQPASYPVTLTVTDDAGTTATAAQTVTPIALSAQGYKVKGLEQVDLTWSGPSGTSFDVYRDGTTIATVEANGYTDSLNRRGSGAYTYRVCSPAASACSNDVNVSF